MMGRPGNRCDGNTHAGEVTGCECCLHLIEQLLGKLDSGDPAVCQMLEDTTVCAVPAQRSRAVRGVALCIQPSC